MGILNEFHGGKVYIDANLFIYALEGYEAFAPLMEEVFAAIDSERIQAVTSELTLAELLVKPFKVGDDEKVSAYSQLLLSSRAFDVHPISRDVLIRAAQIRSGSNLKLPDAIHAATSFACGCSDFLTNDSHFKSIPDLRAFLLSSLIGK